MSHDSSRKYSRRNLIQAAGVGAVAVGLGTKFFSPEPAVAASTAAPVTADQALKMLTEGNQRYVAKRQTHPHQTVARLQEVAKGQNPFAIVLGCADSRVPPEILFDQGLGDVFVIRVAGNIIDDAVLGSIEYAAAELKVPLVMVLGHERCGAVKATLAQAEVPGHISTLVHAIQPAVDRAKKQVKAGKPVSNDQMLDMAVRENVKMTVEGLKGSELLKELIAGGQLKVVGARYDLDQGAVEVIA